MYLRMIDTPPRVHVSPLTPPRMQRPFLLFLLPPSPLYLPRAKLRSRPLLFSPLPPFAITHAATSGKRGLFPFPPHDLKGLAADWRGRKPLTEFFSLASFPPLFLPMQILRATSSLPPREKRRRLRRTAGLAKEEFYAKKRRRNHYSNTKQMQFRPRHF